MEEKLNSTNVEIGTVSVNPETKSPCYKLFDKTEIDAILKDVTI